MFSVKKTLALSASAVAVTLATAGSATAAIAAAPVDVTTNAVVQRDVTAALAYWHVVRPDAVYQCTPAQGNWLTVSVQPMVAAGVDGRMIPTPDVMAETPVGSCQIELSPSFWRMFLGRDHDNELLVSTRAHPRNMVGMFMTGKWGEAYSAAIITHELGNVLGITDSEHSALAIMDPRCIRYDVPTVNLAVYGWAHVGAYDRGWLTLHGLTGSTSLLASVR